MKKSVPRVIKYCTRGLSYGSEKHFPLFGFWISWPTKKPLGFEIRPYAIFGHNPLGKKHVKPYKNM